MFGIPSFQGIQEIKETGFPKGSKVIQEWDGFRVSEMFRGCFKNKMKSEFPGFRGHFGNESSQRTGKETDA